MGFSLIVSFGSDIVLRATHNQTSRLINSKLLFCKTQHKNSVGFNLSNQKTNHTAIFVSKQESIEFDERKSPNEIVKEVVAIKICEDDSGVFAEVKEEIKQCYELINRIGRGVVYLGSSRMGSGHSHYVQAQELAKEAISSQIANLLDCTTWSGAGPGLMDAVTQGALLAEKPVGGFKIGKEAGEWTASNFHPYLPSENYLTCRFFSARKHGLVDAVVRNNSFDKTAVVALPGGIGTLDEVFEMLALIQLERIGSKLPVPFLLMNYDLFYSKLLDFLDVCEDWGTVSKGEVASLWKVCNNNSEALAYLEDFYRTSSGDASQKNETKLHSAHDSPF
ncbi:putative cytokinin riboside 5-monophosphate phosphoribohydrolase logl10-like protein [Trifolium pratense]|uniref:Putative cytokinin riboside 5-monophosphate phosphoribohydrolase logl10-like protein n=1 Tax=Trifolium pratense TaxID=57577 RepID=A0A2K3MUI9_TRIPR|nr:putative cytokinin riboside 5-monophosphate phosphoribohydrolase logl10-like protein [Trifolium pratense]